MPGSHVLSVEFDGFRKHTRSGLALRVGDIVELNIKLELGAVTNGTRTRSSEFTLDGIPNWGGDGVIALQPPPEMIQVFWVQTAAYDASLGRFAGRA